MVGGVSRLSGDLRHDRDAGLEPREAEGELGKHDEGDSDDEQGVAVHVGLSQERRPPVRHEDGVLDDVPDRHDDHHDVEREVDGDEHDGDADRLPETTQEHGSEQCDEHEGDQDLVAVEPGGSEGVLDGVSRGIRRREGDGDHEVGRREAQQHQHEQFAGPPRQQLLEHRDRSGALEALPRDATIDGQRPEQREQHEHDGGEGGEETGGERRDRGLVAEGGEVIDAGEAHDPPPGVGLLSALGMRPLVCAPAVDQPLQEPTAQATGCRGHHIPILSDSQMVNSE